ncbi:hypothetical protein K457DRAFT_151754 [Linnemannia elongata AG-77]|uniref:Uncharacterized protein n=1 Tax=Linnemannia elongata AG-77 TaxID=1314771 RepID=A0A197KFM7_9FUNG|nr:hypothetical protein K457DRAFT_151754 [Linnemannia elongata AG-77]
MNTSRPSSANQKSVANASSTAAAPLRRAKVASAAQMDISSMMPSRPVASSMPGSATVTPTNSSRSSHSMTPSTPTPNGYHTINGNTYNTYNNNTPTPPRMASVRVRSSNSVATTASFRSANGASSAGSGRPDGGSVTSDDGTISEDSDRAGDEMQLFSGGQASVGGGINLPFGSSGRHNSSSSAGLVLSPSSSTVGLKIAGRSNRHRATSSTSGLSFGSGSSQAKPMRMAAGASIKIDPSLSLSNQNALQSSLLTSTTPGSSTAGSLVGISSPAPLTSSASLPTWNNTPSSNAGLGSSLSRSGSLGHSRSGDEGSALSGMSNSSLQPLQQQQQQSTIRSVKSASATTSATVKQAEENRRIEDAARTRRKIADLEISNASLLSINQSLEATIRKQASEVQELKIRMQSAHYGDLGYSAADLALAQSVEAIELTEEEKQDDLTFKRLCMSIEQMIFEAKSALDQCSKPAGVKVLSLHDMYEKEVREAQEVDEEDEDDADNMDGREMSQMTFVQDDDDGIDIKDQGNMKAKCSIEVLAPQEDDEHSDRASDITKNQQQRRRQNSKETRRDSGLSRSSGESMRAQNKRQQGEELFRDDEGDHVNDGGGLEMTSSPHIMISSAVLDTPTIVT